MRLDPLIDHDGFADHYRDLLQEVFGRIDADSIHSVSLGGVRYPKKVHESIRRLYPEEAMLVAGMEQRDDHVGYGEAREAELVRSCRDALLEWLPDEKLFGCPTT